MTDDDEQMVTEAAGLLGSIIERMRREDPNNNPIVQNIDRLEEYAVRRYGSVHAFARGVAYDEGGWLG